MPAVTEHALTLHRPPRPRDDPPAPRWSVAEGEALFALPFAELLHRAHEVHRTPFDPTLVEFATLLSVKTGGCPEDCSYCPQAAQYDTGLQATRLLEPAEVLQA